MERHLTVARTARYQQLGELSAETKHVWFVCHGYGQLAAYFIRHFAFLAEADPHTVVIAPEGLSRFYLSGSSGRVGASWMTRDDRLHEIQDHIGFLNQLAEKVLAECSTSVELTVLGFSQGTATVSRWLVQAAFRPAHLILWAGSFPPDIAPESAQALLRGLRLSLTIGTDDEYITVAQAEEQQTELLQLGGAPQLFVFAGKHTLDRPVLAQLAGLG
ncbi:alpha/beta hydrolase [Hymenobacter monticola]|uniref:Phospholipase n=1 Tax=Hymenobacter monticola TaxID=1705399 RepID=A0ABY4B2G8_9BACT|nr:phospholipase [Hymenobacter monticola]UOE33338.1 phospholipase [Hymenobacter monticola]